MKLKQGMRLKKNGSIEKRFTVDKKVHSVTAKTVSEVLRKEQEMRVSIANGTYTKNVNLTFDMYFSEWIKRKKHSVTESTVLTYTNYYNKWVKPEIGKIKLKSIERRQLLNLQIQIKENGSVYTANYCFRIIKMIFKDAVRDEIIVKNPADLIKYFKNQNSEVYDTTHRALTEEEQKTFFTEAKKQWNYELFALQLLTGMRIGEVCALRWSDIDKQNKLIHITRTYSKDLKDAYIISTTKTDAGTRDIPLTDQMIAVLESTKHKAESRHPIGPHSYIFISSQGNDITPDRARKSLDAMLIRMEKDGHKIERFTSHAFRDTFATRFIEQGGNMKTLQTLLGHATLQITMDKYAHVLPDTRKTEMERLKITV